MKFRCSRSHLDYFNPIKKNGICLFPNQLDSSTASNRLKVVGHGQTIYTASLPH